MDWWIIQVSCRHPRHIHDEFVILFSDFLRVSAPPIKRSNQSTAWPRVHTGIIGIIMELRGVLLWPPSSLYLLTNRFLLCAAVSSSTGDASRRRWKNYRFLSSLAFVFILLKASPEIVASWQMLQNGVIIQGNSSSSSMNSHVQTNVSKNLSSRGTNIKRICRGQPPSQKTNGLRSNTTPPRTTLWICLRLLLLLCPIRLS